MDDKRKKLLQAMGYSNKAIDILERHSHIGELENPAATSTQKGACGDVMMLYLNIENNLITDARFEFIGCAGLQASGSALIELIKGKTVNDVKGLTGKDIINFLENIPAAKYECASIAEKALQKALENYPISK